MDLNLVDDIATHHDMSDMTGGTQPTLFGSVSYKREERNNIDPIQLSSKLRTPFARTSPTPELVVVPTLATNGFQPPSPISEVSQLPSGDERKEEVLDLEAQLFSPRPAEGAIPTLDLSKV